MLYLKCLFLATDWPKHEEQALTEHEVSGHIVSTVRSSTSRTLVLSSGSFYSIQELNP